MLAALAQRVEVVPSTALGAGQHPPDDEAVTGLPWDSKVAADGLTWAALAIDPPMIVPATRTVHASTARPLVRTFMPLLQILQTFSQVYTE
jgi:hypothetical protein